MAISHLILICVLFFITIVISIGGGIKIIKKENFIKYENAAPAKQEFMKRNEKKFDIGFKTVFVIMMSFMTVEWVISGVQDIPNVINSNYQIVEGTAMTAAGKSDRKFPKIVTIKSTSGEEIRLRFYSVYSIEKGDKLKVTYLPHLKRGTLLKHSR